MPKEAKKNKTTPADFQIFKDECNYWIKYFGLYNYEVRYFHRQMDMLASCNISKDRTDRYAALSLSISYGIDDVNDKALRQVAFHEVMEMLLWKIGDLIHQFVGSNVERDEIHKVIRTFENTVFEESYRNRFPFPEGYDLKVKKQRRGKR